MKKSAGSGEYSGAITAVPYAFRASNSRLCKLYVLIGGLFTLGATVLFGLGIIALLGSVTGASAGVLTFQPALYILVWLFTVSPIIAPVLLVARRHRLGEGTDDYDRKIALAGFCFLAALYVGALIAAPAGQRGTVNPGLFAPLIRVLYGLPRLAGAGPPLVALLVMVAVHRLHTE